MPRFEPFAGLRYDPDEVALDDVVAPPYDVIAPAEQAALEARSEFSAVRVELPRDEPGRDRYTAAAALLEDWRAQGVLRADEPSLYGYRMSFTDESGKARTTTGVLGALALEAPGEGSILPHERTMPKPKSDRLDLLRATRANLSPIWGLSLAPGVTATIGAPTAALAAIDDDGVRHEIWLLDESASSAVRAAIEAAPIVLADGHHRFETALAYQREQRDAGRATGDHDLVLTLVVELAADQLDVRPIHRLLNQPGLDLPAALAEWFDIEPTDAGDDALPAAMAEVGALALVTDAGRWLLRPREVTEAAAERPLDSCRLDVALDALRLDDVTYQHGVGNVIAAVKDGAASAGVLLRPATVDQIFETAEARDRMPPKTTFFWPKPRTGMVFRVLGD